MIKSRRYRHVIHFQRPVNIRHPETGAVSRSWQTATLDGDPLNQVPAEVLTGQGREIHAADTKLAETTARIKLGWFPGLEPAWRALWDGRIFDILSIETDATARKEYRLRCRDGLSDGS